MSINELATNSNRPMDIDLDTGEIVPQATDLYRPTGKISQYNVGTFKIVRNGLVVEGAPSFEEWCEFGEWLQFIQTSVQFAIGDWINYGEKRWGEKYAQAIEETPYSQGSLQNFASIAHKFDISRRREELPFTHYCEVASLPSETADTLLERAAHEEWSSRDIRREARRVKYESTASQFPSDKYRIIYADPPWDYNSEMPRGSTACINYYPTMSLDAICALPVANISEDNAVLFLWTTSPILEEAFQVIRAWGFQYKASFVWDKIKHNVGHYNSVRHEFLLVCVRGSCTPDVQKLFDSVVTLERGEHSEKPEIFREYIDTLYPVGKRIELFARKVIEGWDSYGNQLPG